MSKNNIDALFKNLEHDFDVERPNDGHETRFLDKLNNKEKSVIKITRSRKNTWKPLMGIAASIALIITLFLGTQQQNESRELASVSPKMEETQDFFTATINEELNKLKEASSPEVEKLVQDALKQIKILENDYVNLKTDLTKSGDDNRVIYAMISNFQNRIDILKSTLNKIKTIKQLKKSSNETSKSII
tara:strand:- start:600 stop:1166 length:567 start_codon:yes stop_codon:yes gene_type:complete